MSMSKMVAFPALAAAADVDCSKFAFWGKVDLQCSDKQGVINLVKEGNQNDIKNVGERFNALWADTTCFSDEVREQTNSLVANWGKVENKGAKAVGKDLLSLAKSFIEAIEDKSTEDCDFCAALEAKNAVVRCMDDIIAFEHDWDGKCEAVPANKVEFANCNEDFIEAALEKDTDAMNADLLSMVAPAYVSWSTNTCTSQDKKVEDKIKEVVMGAIGGGSLKITKVLKGIVGVAKEIETDGVSDCAQCQLKEITIGAKKCLNQIFQGKADIDEEDEEDDDDNAPTTASTDDVETTTASTGDVETTTTSTDDVETTTTTACSSDHHDSEDSESEDPTVAPTPSAAPITMAAAAFAVVMA